MVLLKARHWGQSMVPWWDTVTGLHWGLSWALHLGLWTDLKRVPHLALLME